MASFGLSDKKQSTKTEWALTSATHCLSVSSIADCVLSWGVEDDSVKTWAQAYVNARSKQEQKSIQLLEKQLPPLIANIWEGRKLRQAMWQR